MPSCNSSKTIGTAARPDVRAHGTGVVRSDILSGISICTGVLPLSLFRTAPTKHRASQFWIVLGSFLGVDSKLLCLQEAPETMVLSQTSRCGVMSGGSGAYRLVSGMGL